MTMVTDLKKHLRNPVSKLLALTLGAGALLTFILQSFEMNFIEAYLYDFRMRHKGDQSQLSEHIVLVKIDDRTVEQLNEFSPLSIRRHVSLLEKFRDAHPKAIAYLLNFNDSLPAEGDLGGRSQGLFKRKKKAEDPANKFVGIADEFYAKGIPVILGTDIDVTGEVMAPFPLSKLPHHVAVIHKDGSTFSEDKVTRRALFSIYDQPVLHTHLAGLINGKLNIKDYHAIYQMPEIDANYFFINYVGPTQEGAHHFKEISAVDILDGKVPPQTFTDKIVLIGSQTKEDSGDYSYTPYSRAILTNPKLVVHANILETLIHDKAIVKASKLADILLTLLFTSLMIAMIFRATPVHPVLVTLSCSLAIVALAMGAFKWLNIWICLSHPLAGIFFAYYVFVPYRLLVEYKKRWEFQKKNEVLVQVEELKSNFMSLITHDLKTPVARIQGLAELLGRSGKDPQIISQIMESTDELNRFISSILELARIESNRVKLEKQSKDINAIIEASVKKFEFSARTKGISIETDLEPLFPIKIDASLISKVIGNLIDNAIKYSPERARITVESRESTENPGYVEITVTDNGHGISSKDLENLFLKFYRPKNDITMQTKGTGLGLYLSRYFVELHNGSLEAESIIGRGSMFTILLPLEEEAPAMEFHAKKGENAYV